MPLYVYVIENVEGEAPKSIDVLRNFSEYDVGPTEEEALGAGLTPEQVATATYRKVLGSGVKLIKGASWGPGKGYWIRHIHYD